MKFKFYLFTSICLLNMVVSALGIIPGFFRMASTAIIVWSFYYFYKVNTLLRPGIYIKGLTIITLLIIIYGFALLFSNTVIYKLNGERLQNYAYLITYTFSILPIYSFYYFTKLGIIHDCIIKKLFYSFLVCYVLLFFKTVLSGRMDIDNVGDMTNNHGYLFASLIPMLFLVKQKLSQNMILLVVIMIFIVFSAKRGAILVGSVSFLIYYIFNFKKKMTLKNVLIYLSSIIFLYYCVENIAESNFAFQAKMNKTLDGDDSGRMIIYTGYYNYFISQYNSLAIIFGNGADSAMKLFGFYAHNDWLEFALSQGLIGIFSYFLYWIMFGIGSRRIKIQNFKLAAYSLWITYFLMSLFSMSINALPLSASFSIGHIMAFDDKMKG